MLSYGQALSPLVFVPVAGAWLGRIGSIATAVGQACSARKRPDPIETQRQAIEEALSKLTDPIVIVIDDLDRLSAQEVRDMLSLVRLTAHFPKIIYLLAFDRAKVERALGDGGLDDGRSYLDKIVEVAFDMPLTSQPALERILLEGLDQATSGVTTGPLDADRAGEVFARVLRPLLSTPREVNRYLAPLPAMLGIVGEEVALVDVLALEAIRVRLPEVFAELGPMSRALTSTGMLTSQTPGWETEVRTFIDSSGPYALIVTDVCRLLFPATERYLGSNAAYSSNQLSRWRNERRVASPEVLSTYLSKLLPHGALPAATLDQAVAALTDPSAFQAIVDGLSADDLDDLLSRLVGYEDDFPAEAALPASTVLLEVYPRLRTHSTGFMDPGPEMGIERVVLRLLRRVENIDERTRIVEALCADVAGFTGRVKLLRLAGRRSNPVNERLVPAADSDRLYQQVCHEIRHASWEQLAAERNLLGLVAEALTEDPADREGIDRVLDDDEFATALLLSARPHAPGGLIQPTEHALRWELLGTAVGDNKAIAGLVDRVAAQGIDDEELERVVKVARQYLSGWRPPPDAFTEMRLVIREARNPPSMIFSPSVISSGWPALHLRAVTSYEVDPIWAAQADMSGRETREHIAAFLAGVPLAGQVASLAEGRGLAADIVEWKPDPDVGQFSRAAVQRLVLGPDGQPAAVLRYAVFLPDNTGPMRLFTDMALSPTEATDAKWGPLRARGTARPDGRGARVIRRPGGPRDTPVDLLWGDATSRRCGTVSMGGARTAG